MCVTDRPFGRDNGLVFLIHKSWALKQKNLIFKIILNTIAIVHVLTVPETGKILDFPPAFVNTTYSK
jgi:hypothetical protein